MNNPDIVLYHHGKAHLPGIYSYISIFSALGIKCVIEHREKGFVPFGRIHWKFMGMVTDNPGTGKIAVHEYTSTSVPPFPRIKDFIKKTRNVKPDMRVFQNKLVGKVYSYNDNVPFFYRPVICGEIFFKVPKIPHKYDFVYCGTLDPTRKIDKPLFRLIKFFPGRSFLIIGQPPAEISEELSRFSNVTVTGKVPYEKVPELMASARYGLNLVPDIYPFNQLISTKLLEYTAIGLPVLTLGGAWLDSFEKENGARFFRIGRDNLNKLDDFEFIVPSVNDYHPDSVFRKSGIIEWVQKALGT
ncbi:MAG: glycosyltransferase family 4 protein [Fibrobacter sp.]|jgi:hypothetical protein|nr:glycosyltransferase family 4 protein [Fibrobacter sp.]